MQEAVDAGGHALEEKGFIMFLVIYRSYCCVEEEDSKMPRSLI